MFKPGDANTFTKHLKLFHGTPKEDDSNLIGDLTADYYTLQFNDIKLQDTGSLGAKSNRSFLITCTQRIRILNNKTRCTRVGEAIKSYDDYPSLIHTIMKLTPDEGAGIAVRLIDYSPHTVNTTVQHSGSTGGSRGENKGTSRSSTVGSATATTNSYGATVNVGGLMGESVSGNYEHSQTETSEQSETQGSESSRSKTRETSSSASMSIKDWGAYGWVEPQREYPCWMLGQEYPWDAVLFRQVDMDKKNPNNDKQVQAVIPKDMLLRLCDANDDGVVTCLYPPSQLSLFGLDFVMKAVWLVTIPNQSSDTIAIDHHIFYNTASHGYFKNPDIRNVAIYIDKQAVKLQSKESKDGSISTELNFPLIALDPVGSQGHNAIVGFMPNKFTVKPQPSTSSARPIPFKIISATNDLIMFDSTIYPEKCDEHAGFVATPTAMKAHFAKNCAALTISAYFKITNPTIEYTLHIKHWKLESTDVKLTIVVNKDKDNTIVKYVDARETEGGEDNILSISLRDLRYASGDFHDYLQVGFNCIEITIEPACGQLADRESEPACGQADRDGYGIRAISIE